MTTLFEAIAQADVVEMDGQIVDTIERRTTNYCDIFALSIEESDTVYAAFDDQPLIRVAGGFLATTWDKKNKHTLRFGLVQYLDFPETP